MFAVSRHGALLLCVLLSPGVALGERPAELPSDAELERSGAVIGKIIIDNLNVFDLNIPKDDTPLFRSSIICTRAPERTSCAGSSCSCRVISIRAARCRSPSGSCARHRTSTMPRLNPLPITTARWTSSSEPRCLDLGSAGLLWQKRRCQQHIRRRAGVERLRLRRGRHCGTQHECRPHADGAWHSGQQYYGSRIAASALYSVNSDGYQRDLFVDRPSLPRFALDGRCGRHGRSARRLAVRSRQRHRSIPRAR